MKDYKQIKEEFSGLVEYLNDMFSLGNEEFNHVLENIILSYFLMPILKDLFFLSFRSSLNTSECFLTIYMFMTKIKSSRIKSTFLQIFFNSQSNVQFSEGYLGDFKEPSFYSFTYSIDEQIDFDNKSIQEQLNSIFTKTQRSKKGSISNMLQIMVKQPIQSIREFINVDLKEWHKKYTRFTGVISFFTWEEELKQHQTQNMVDLIYNKSGKARPVSNKISNWFMGFMSVK